jgi:hypothetical protein
VKPTRALRRIRDALPRVLGAGLVVVALLATSAGATGPGGPNGGRSRAASAFPAGPTPRNPAGPTPRNPAGPPPLNAPGSFANTRPLGVRPPVFVGNDAFFQPQPFVSVVGPSTVPVLLDGSFFCGVHDRGFATQQFFFDHLATSDGLAPEEAIEMLVDGGGVWVFTGE